MYQIINDWLLFNIGFNEPLSNVVFPAGIQKVIFSSQFNQVISQLPNSITHLSFCVYFNQEMHNLPNSLTHLSFGYYFNQDVSNLPNSLTYLSFGWYFNQDISQLPKSITYLKFSGWIDSKFNHNLNPYLYHLTDFYITDSHKQKRLMVERCQTNTHNISIREDKLIDLLLKN